MPVIEPNRVIEINNLGRFYVMNEPKFTTMYIPDLIDDTRSGWIIIKDSDLMVGAAEPIGNCVLFKILPNGNLMPALFKSFEMAEEVCYACNRIRV